MYRMMWVIVAVGVFVSPIPAQQKGGVKLGEKLEGEMKDKALWVVGSGAHKVYRAELLVALKAGQSISILATVVGKERRVVLRLLDPDGAVIGDPLKQKDPMSWPVKTSQYTHEEVSVSGKYKIEVYSDLA